MEEAKIRKSQNILICSGQAVILFGIWSIIRMFLLIYLDPLQFEEMVRYSSDIPHNVFRAFIYAGVGTALLADLILRLFMGLSAIREGKSGIPGKRFYLIVVSLYLALSLFADGYSILSSFGERFDIRTLASAIIDISSCTALAEIIVSSEKLREATGKTKRTGGRHAA